KIAEPAVSLRPSTPTRQPTTECRAPARAGRGMLTANRPSMKGLPSRGATRNDPDAARAVEHGPDVLGTHHAVGVGELDWRRHGVGGDAAPRHPTDDEAHPVTRSALRTTDEARRERMLLRMLVQPRPPARRGGVGDANRVGDLDAQVVVTGRALGDD